MKNIQRYTTVALPIVPYIPGFNQRKTVTQQIESLPLAAISEVKPIDNTLFLFGVDLFNGGFYWEAHEAWEELWHAEKDLKVRRTLQGLIQMTAGFVKVRQCNKEGIKALFSAALDKISLEVCDQLAIDCKEMLKAMRESLEVVDRGDWTLQRGEALCRDARLEVHPFL